MTQARFEEALYQAPVTDKALHPRARIPVWIPIVLVVCGLVFANYQYLKFGPDWAHVVDTGPPGSTWKMYTDPSGIPVRMPGLPIVDRVNGPTGAVDRALNEVDGAWVVSRDANSTSAGAIESARSRRHATVIFATTTAPGDLSSAGWLLGSIAPGASFEGTAVTPVPGRDDAVDVVAGYAGFPDPVGSGTTRARVTKVGEIVTIAAVLTQGGDDPALSDLLLSGVGGNQFTP